MSLSQQPHSQSAPSLSSSSLSADSPFDPLLSLESAFYQSGYSNGLPHGELHGKIEGRELGRDKAWELWEEIGYAEGAGRFWKAVLGANGKDEGRPAQNLDALLSLVDQFPSSNNSSSLAQPPSSSSQDPSSPSTSSSTTPTSIAAEAEIDIPSLLSSLRSKYRTACASLGVRPRMQVAGNAGGSQAKKMTEANGDGLEGVREASLVV